MSKLTDIFNDYDLLLDDDFELTKTSIEILDSRDKYSEDRAFLIYLCNNYAEEDGDDYFFDMLPNVKFILEDTVAYTTPDKLISLNYPCDSSVVPQDKDRFMRWYFIYCHECLHQLWETFDVAKEIQNAGIEYNHEILNIASDCVINDYLMHINKSHKKVPTAGITPEGLKNEYGVEYNRNIDTQFTLYKKLLALAKSKRDELQQKYGDNSQQGGQQQQNGGQQGGGQQGGGQQGGGQQGGGQQGGGQQQQNGGQQGGDQQGGSQSSNNTTNDDVANAAQNVAKSAQAAADAAKQAAEKSGDAADKKAADAAQAAANEAKDAADKATAAAKNDDKNTVLKETQRAIDAAKKATEEANKVTGKGNSSKDTNNTDKNSGNGDSSNDKDKNNKSDKTGGKSDSKSDEKSDLDKMLDAAKETAKNANNAAGKDSADGSDGKDGKSSDSNNGGNSNSNGGDGADGDSDGGDKKVITPEMIKKRTQHAEATIRKYRDSISGSLGEFVKKCQISKKLKPGGLAMETKKGAGSWDKEVALMCKAYVKQKLKTNPKYKDSYEKIRRGERPFTQAELRNGGRVIQPGRIIKKNKIGFDICLYIDTSGSMSSHDRINTVFDTVYDIADDLKTTLGADQKVDKDKIQLRTFVFDTKMKEINYKERVNARGSTYSFHDLLSDIHKNGTNAFLNIIITDGEFASIDQNEVAKIIKEMDSLFVLVTNNTNNGIFDKTAHTVKVKTGYERLKVVYTDDTFAVK